MMTMTKKMVIVGLATILSLSACGQSNVQAPQDAPVVSESSVTEHERKAPEIDGLTYDHQMEVKYADGFDIYYYQDGYKVIDIPESGTYLVIPEGKDCPEALPSGDIKCIYQNVDNIYMAATSVMSFFDAMDAVDKITMTGTDVDGWYIDAPKKALEAGTMTYAGKYSAPDYEMLVAQDCDLVIESTMIYHAPEVQEMLEDLDFTVFIDRSSYEAEVLGRVEWIKVYGAILNLEDKAEAVFESQHKIVEDLEDFESTGKTIAFFAINSSGSVVIRKTDDIVPNMIGIAGGVYAFENLTDIAGGGATVDISMEEFFADACDADYLIYNATIETPLTCIDDLIEKDALFKEFKAVQEGQVWQVDSKWYQSTATTAELITDVHLMLLGEDESQLTYIHKVAE